MLTELIGRDCASIVNMYVYGDKYNLKFSKVLEDITGIQDTRNIYPWINPKHYYWHVFTDIKIQKKRQLPISLTLDQHDRMHQKQGVLINIRRSYHIYRQLCMTDFFEWKRIPFFKFIKESQKPFLVEVRNVNIQKLLCISSKDLYFPDGISIWLEGHILNTYVIDRSKCAIISSLDITYPFKLLDYDFEPF